jgi:hypothetical protein
MVINQMVSRRAGEWVCTEHSVRRTPQGRAQWSTIPRGEGAARRIAAGFREDPRRGNLFP